MDRFLFSDEAGDFTFNRNPNVSRYFIICTVTTNKLELAEALNRLRHDLLREGASLGDFFHATSDAQEVRDRVYSTTIGTKKERLSYTNALGDVVQQSARKIPWIVDFRPSLADPMLQVADYCAWAVGRAWERGDYRSLDPMRERMTYQFELWRHGRTLYY